MSPLGLTLIVAIALVGFQRPHWGVFIFLALLPLEGILPATFAGSSAVFQSPLAALGGAAVLGGAVSLFLNGRLRPGVGANSTTLLSFLFSGWMFLAHPAGSWAAPDGRNWLFTFGQLWLLALAAGAALDTDGKHLFAMATFSLACLISAIVATATGTIADDRGEGVRVAGLGLGANAVARQYVVGIVLMTYLHLRSTKAWLRTATLVAVACLAIGVVFTQSRAGLFLAPLSLISVPLIAAKRKIARTALIGVVVGSIGLFLLPEGAVGSAISWFSPESVRSNASNESVISNVRYRLWDAGLAMWRDRRTGPIPTSAVRGHLVASVGASRPSTGTSRLTR